MKSVYSRTSFVVVSLLLFICNIYTFAYDENLGVEYNDVLDVTFTSYINRELQSIYTPEAPFRLRVNSTIINVNLVNELIGMTLGETKQYISWVVETNLMEYYDLTVIHLVEDSTPGTETTPEQTALNTNLYLITTSILLYLFIKRVNQKRNRSKESPL